MKPIARLFFTLLISVSILWSTDLLAHEFETGHIERSIDVVVRGQQVQVKYSLGLADETIVDWMSREGLLTKQDETRFRKCIAELESKSVGEKASESLPSESQPAQKTKVELKAVEPLAFQTELMQLLRDKLSKAVCENLRLSLDGQEIEFSDTKVTNSSRHHVAMEIVLLAKLAASTTTEMSLVDQNFLELVELADASTAEVDSDAVTDTVAEIAKKHRYFGNVRLACRVKGDAILLNSNVSPVLARAKVISIGPLTLEERKEAATIRTKIGFVKSKAP